MTAAEVLEVLGRDMLAAALDFAQRGIPVIPLWHITRTPEGLVCGCGNAACQSPGKHPLSKLVPHGLKDASTDPDTISAWWMQEPFANIGLLMGQVAGLIAVDIDGDQGWASVKDMPFPPGPISITGRGEHRLYAWPGFRIAPKVALLPGVDLRGDGSYIVAPPSSHVSGRFYHWAEGLSLDDIEPPPCPGRVLELLKAEKPRSEWEAPEATIRKGERNAALTSLAGTMRRRGMTQGEIEAALLGVNAERCNPPLAEEEVRAIGGSVARYEPEEEADPYAMQKDYGHARVLSKPFAGRYRWATHRGSWMEYTGSVWRPAPEEQIATVAADTLRQHYVAGLAAAKDKRRVDELTDKIRETCVFARVMSALSFLKGWEGVLTMPEAWDKDAWALNVANGTLDLRTGDLRPHDAGDLLTKLAPAVYDPDATGPAWDAHLGMFLPNANICRQVQRSLGVALVGATLEEALDIWHGAGGNGKTTTARALMAICGDYSLRAAPDLLIDTKHERHPTEIADLCGSRLIFSVEVAEGKRLAEALVKDLTGGDRKKARFMREDFFQFEQTFSIVLIVNHKPVVLGSDEAIWRRIRLIRWEHKIGDYPGHQQPQEEVVPELVAEGSAILNWLLAGLRDWQSDHYWLAPEVQTATAAYREDQDRLAGFLADSCEFEAHFTAPVGDLYDAYTHWCGTASEEAIGKKHFGELLRERGIAQRRAERGLRKWLGVRLRPMEPENHAEQGELPQVTNGDDVSEKY